MQHRLIAAVRLLAAVLLGLIACPAFAAAGNGPAPSSTAPATPSAEGEGRVFVLGFDGADWRKTESMMDAGELPNLAKLRDMGTAGPLISTDPAESAAGWAAINTGANPVKNGIPSFIKRTISGDAILPGFAHVDTETVPTEGMEMAGATALLDRISSGNSMGYGIGVLVLAFLLFRFVLRANGVLALLLGVVLGGATAYATSSAGGAVPAEIPGVVTNQVKLDGFWVDAARKGHPTVALQAPLAFGRPGAEGARTLYGLGVPDVRGSLNGDWFVYTTDTLATGRPPKGFTKRTGSGTGVTYRVDFKKPKDGGEKMIDARLYGPVNVVAIDEAKTRHAEITDTLDNPEKRGSIGFQESRTLLEERGELEELLAEMGQAIPGSMAAGNTSAKLYKHRVMAPLQVVPAGEGSYDVTIGQTTQTLNGSEWSDIYGVEFELSPVLSVHAVTRARVVNTEPFELYVDTLQFDPANPTFWQPTSSPLGFSAELASGIGSSFETLGWGCMTNQVKDKLVDPVYFMEDVEFTMTFRRKLMQRMLEQDDWKVLYSVFSTTDRVQHMMYRFHDPEHPNYDAKKAAETMTFFGEEITLADAIPAIYKQMDSIVGEAMAALGPNDTLMLCADHGFTSYRRGMHVNNWLAKEGFLTLKDLSGGGSLMNVDWENTKAYGLGLGMVYLNLEGREPNGIVTMEEAGAVMEDIRARFLAAEDEGRDVGSSATIMRDTYVGSSSDAKWGTVDYPCADVMLGFAEYYRVSWKSVGGETVLRKERNDDGEDTTVIDDIYDDNRSPWSGDHASNDPNLVSGIFFCNRKVSSEDGTFSVMDIAPTVLDRLGAEMPGHFDRKPLSFD